MIIVLIKESSRSKSARLLLHFGEVVGFDEVLDELFCFGDGESNDGDGVNPVFLGDGVVVFVFLGSVSTSVSEVCRLQGCDAKLDNYFHIRLRFVVFH